MLTKEMKLIDIRLVIIRNQLEQEANFEEELEHRAVLIRPQNIYWQNWKYRFQFSSVKVKTVDVTVQRAEVVENIGLKFQFQNQYSIHLLHVVHAMTRNYLCRLNVQNKIVIDSIGTH